MARKFNLEKILEDSYTMDLNDVEKLMGRSADNFLFNVRFLERGLSIDWDDEVHIISVTPAEPPPSVEESRKSSKYIRGTDSLDFFESQAKQWMKVGRRVSYVLEGVGPDGEQIIYYRRSSPSRHSTGVTHTLYIDGDSFPVSQFVEDLGDQQAREKFDWEHVYREKDSWD